MFELPSDLEPIEICKFLCQDYVHDCNFSFSLNQIRAKVWKARTTSTLFDVRQYCQDMENLLYKIWKRYEEGKKPDHITE